MMLYIQAMSSSLLNRLLATALMAVFLTILLFGENKVDAKRLQDAGVRRLFAKQSKVRGLLYGSASYFEFHLINTKGQQLQTWKAIPQAPIRKIADWQAGPANALLNERTLYAIFPYSELQVYSDTGELIESYPQTIGRAIASASDGSLRLIHFIESELEIAGSVYPVLLPELIFFHKGQITKKVSLQELLKTYVSEAKLQKALARVQGQEQTPPYNIYRPDSLQLVKQDTAQSLQRDDMLLSFRNLDLLLLLRADASEVTWSLQDDLLHAPSDAVLTEDASLLVFNSEIPEGQSVVHRVSLADKKSTWSYEPNQIFPFEAPTGGSVESLDEASVLVHSASSGLIQEIQADGLVVWEFVNPNRHRDGLLKEDKNRPAGISFIQLVSDTGHFEVDSREGDDG